MWEMKAWLRLNLLGSHVDTAVHVAVLGANGQIGQSLSLLLKKSLTISSLRLYDIAPGVRGVAVDLSHINTPCKVSAHVGSEEIESALRGADLVVIPAGMPRKPGMTRDDLFKVNADICVALTTEIAKHFGFYGIVTGPTALIHVITNPVNSTVPLIAEVLKGFGVYNPRKLFGVTELDVVRAAAITAAHSRINIEPSTLHVPVIGGHSGKTILPLLSLSNPRVNLREEEQRLLRERIRDAGTAVVQAKGNGSATLSMAYAAARHVEKILGTCTTPMYAYVACKDLAIKSPADFFATKITADKNGIRSVVSPFEFALTQGEQKDMIDMVDELNANIDKGRNYKFKNW